MRLFPLLLPALLAVAPSARAVDDAALRAADASWNALRLSADVAALDRLLADDWQLTHSDGRVEDKAGYLRQLQTRNRRNEAIENRDVVLRRYGDAAVVTGTSVQAGTSGGQPWQGRFRFTRVWLLRDGRWVMVASHSSRIAQAR